jgi:hypothetical protein
MADFSNSTGFGAAARAAPRTVTYNQDTVTEAQFRSARMGSRVIGGTLGTAAVLLAIVALTMSWAFTSSLAVSWGEVIKLGLIGSALVAAMAGLPVAAAMMSRSYPQEARHAMRAWLVALLIVAGAAVVFAVRLERPSDKAAPARLMAVPLGSPAVRSLYMTDSIWRDTAGCATMKTLYHEEVCGEYRYTLTTHGIPENREVVADTAPIDWSPAGVLGVEGLADGATRQGIVLLLTLIATGGAGILGRWATLATAESYRLGEGMASALPAMPAPAAAASLPPVSGASMSPIEVFDLWFAGRVRHDAGGRLSASAAFGDYEQTATINGFAALSQRRFGELLTRKAEGSGGRISKVKSNGAHFYAGLALASESEAMDVRDGSHANDNYRAAPYRS